MRHESNYNSINQFYNGGWELVDSDGEPAFWEIEGASLEDDLSVYEVTPDGLQLRLSSQIPTKIVQTFTEPAGPLDFRGDLGPSELGDGDLEVPAAWSEDEPGIRPRKGNYPYQGTELAGSPKHGPESDTTSPGTNLSEQFESRFGRAYLDPGAGPREWQDPSNNPLVDQQLEHTHQVNKASSRLLAVEYLFCKRV
jgi:hypothetical protein